MDLNKQELEQIFEALQLQKMVEETILHAQGQEPDNSREEPIIVKFIQALDLNEEELDKKTMESMSKLNAYDNFQFEEELLWHEAELAAEKEIHEKNLNLNQEQQFELACKKHEELLDKLSQEAQDDQED